MLAASMTAELFKLRRRPATWVLLGVYAIAVLLLNYLLLYILIRTGQFEEAGPGVDVRQVRDGLLPAAVPSSVVSSAASFGAPVALILGALFVGSEYSWGTVKTIAVQRPARTTIAVGQLLSVTLIVLLYAIVATITAVVASLVVAALESQSAAAPPLGEVVAATGAAWLVLIVWAALGMALATVFRGTGLAIGLGLVWALVVESIAASLPLPGRIGDVLGRVLLGTNSNALAAGFGDVSPFGTPPPVNEPWQAALTLAAYLVLFAVLVVIPFQRREIS